LWRFFIFWVGEPEMEIKFRYKGKEKRVDGFREIDIPENIRPKGGYEGVDLTRYRVIYAHYGRGGEEKARTLAATKEGLIVIVYTYEWRNGWGQGVLLPDFFNPEKVVFYKSTEQEEKSRKEEEFKKRQELAELVEREIPGTKAQPQWLTSGVEVCVFPVQQTWADWGVYASSLDEAKREVAGRRQLWEEWERRAVGVAIAHGYTPCGLQICPSPLQAGDTVQVCLDYNRGVWVKLRREGDVWKEI
jgi:hypothetical protein